MTNSPIKFIFIWTFIPLFCSPEESFKMMKIIIFFLLFCQHQLVTADNYDLDYGISLEYKTWTPVLVGEPNIIISKSVLEAFRQTKTFKNIIEMTFI